KAANYTMNRKEIRDLAANKLGLKTAAYFYATSGEELKTAVDKLGMPCVVKPLMSSSGKGQSVIKTEEDIEKAWKYAVQGSRGDLIEVIVEEFVPFDSEITLLTVTQKNGNTLFCPPIGHVQERGDYQQSWQPAKVEDSLLETAQRMAAEVTQELGGAGIWGVEFFLTKDAVYFSELSPRPHDTGMVTLANTQNYNEFELHFRAILGIPIPEIKQLQAGVSAVILAREHGEHPVYEGIEEALQEPYTDIKVFGKQITRPYRRMAVALAYDKIGCDMEALIAKTKNLASKVKVD
ncbi:MAG: formate-dependent phosphoribosylglycinamide formyltransferase, partial [Flavobacteriales bacterium]